MLRADLRGFPVHGFHKGFDGVLVRKLIVSFQFPAAVYAQGVRRVCAGGEQKPFQQFPDGQGHPVFQAGPGTVQRRDIDLCAQPDRFVRIRDIQHGQRGDHFQGRCRIYGGIAVYGVDCLFGPDAVREPDQQDVLRFQGQAVGIVNFRHRRRLRGGDDGCGLQGIGYGRPFRYSRGLRRRLSGCVDPDLRLRNGHDIVHGKQNHFHRDDEDDAETGQMHVAAPGAGDPGQQRAADAGPVKTEPVLQHAKQASGQAADGIQDDIVHVRNPEVEQLGEFNKQGDAGRNCGGAEQLLLPSISRMQQHLEKADRYKQKYIAEEIERMRQPFR